MIWAIPAAMAAVGALQGASKNRRANEIEDADRKLAAETARYSPWTGMTPQQIRRNQGSMFGDVLGGGMSGFTGGMMLGQGIGGGGTSSFGTAAPAALDQGVIQQQTLSPWEKLKQQSMGSQGSMFA